MKRIYNKTLPKAFYQQTTENAAKALLGKILVHETKNALTAGRIVEVEAYLYHNDPACHASRGMTPRNAPMFGSPGTAYIYLIYGIHYCFNVVTAIAGEGEAVLIRALEPLTGIEIMKERRGCDIVRKLCSGPGNLCRALGITAELNGHPLSGEPLYIANDGFTNSTIVTTPRIGISQAVDLPLRFYLADNLYVSRK